MKTLSKPPLLIVKDSLIGVWLFYAIFILSGGVCIACPFGLCVNSGPPFAVKEYIALLIGSVCLITGAAMIYNTPFTTTTFNREKNVVSIRQRGLFTNRLTALALSEIREPVILEKEGTEGLGYQLNLKLVSEEVVPLSAYWAADKGSIEEAAAAIRSIFSQDRI